MLVYMIEVLDPAIASFQFVIASIIALISIIFSLIKSYLSERTTGREKRVLEEMKQFKEVAREQDERRKQEELKKWEQSDQWSISAKEDGGSKGKGDKGEDHGQE